MEAYHGSPNKFNKFCTSVVFLAKNKSEALSYGINLYSVKFIGTPMFETATIYVVRPENIVQVKQLT